MLDTDINPTWKNRKVQDQRLLQRAGQKRKALSDEVGKLKVKRRALQTDAEALSASADDFQIKQRNCSNELLAKANGM